MFSDVDSFIVETLAADANLKPLINDRIFFDIAPPGIQLPCLIYSLPGESRDYNIVAAGNSPNRLFSVVPLIIKVVTKDQNFTQCDTIMRYVEVALESAFNGKVQLYRSGYFRYVEMDGDERYNYFGYRYQVYEVD